MGGKVKKVINVIVIVFRNCFFIILILLRENVCWERDLWFLGEGLRGFLGRIFSLREEFGGRVWVRNKC